MQARTERSESSDAEPKRGVVWCDVCGIPYAANTAFCATCGAVLVEGQDNAASAGEPVAVPALAAPGISDDATARGLAPEPGEATLPPPGARARRFRKRVRPLSDGEVEAAAAAIIVRARAASAEEEAMPRARDAMDFLPDLLPDPVVEAALLQHRERDRLWLIAGAVCSIVLILCALAVSRYLAGGLPLP